MAMDLSQFNSIVRAEDAGSMPRPVHGYGSVVAFEGNADLISTQLRLLPISSKILILNSLLDAIPRFAAGSKFDAPSFVAHVHKVFAARAATARSFLEDSTEGHPRLVLMNGGSMSAKAACLEKICEKVTSGDLAKAQAVYDDIVRSCGLDNMVPAFISAYPELILSRQTSPMAAEFPAQLPKSTTTRRKEQPQEPSAIVRGRDMDLESHESKKTEMPYLKDPGFVAMRAASILDRATASLHSYQNYEHRSERDTATTRTSMETSVWGLSRAGTVKTVSDGPSDVLSLMSRGRTLIRGTLRDRRMGRKRFSSLDSNLLSVDLGHNSFEAPQTTSPTNLPVMHEPLGPLSSDSQRRWTRYSEATTVSTHRDLDNLLRSGSNRDPKSIPPTPIVFEFGEARLVSVASSRNLKRTSSVDGILTIPEGSLPTRLAQSAALKHSYSAMCLREEPATFAKDRTLLSSAGVTGRSRKVTVKASKRSLDKRIEAPPSERESSKADMVDRGCSPMRFNSSGKEYEAISPTQNNPPSPTVEDLIIHVDDGHRSKILEAIMNGYRNSTNSLATQSSSKLNSGALSATVFSKSTSVTRPPNPIQTKSTITTECRYSEQKLPFAHYQVQPSRKNSALTRNSSSEKDYSQITINATPPTPASTPPPAPQSTAQVRKLSDFGILPPSPSTLPTSNTKVNQVAKLEDFGIINSSSIETQNSLRTTLAKHFPSKHGYSQYPIKNEFSDRLWKPVFEAGDDESTIVGTAGRRTMDQILALGCDDFVERSVWTNVLARVEGLGMLKDGSAVGKFDMQYLMTTAMETFTTLPLSHQALQTSNPFTSPDKLAKLFVPHLERYLSSNPSFRFLIITFPSGSLSSMIALRNLLGVEAMKVAMVSNPRPSTPIQSTPSSQAINKLSNEATIALNSRKRVPLSRLGNSKAQALLGNEQIPKPIGLKKSTSALSQLGRSSQDDSEQQDRPDFVLEITSVLNKELVDRGVDDFVHKIRTVLVERNSIYGSAIPVSPQFAIANWSAANAPPGRHSPTSSTSSNRRKGRKLTKQPSIDAGASPATFGRPRGHELTQNGLLRTYSQTQRGSPQHLETRTSDSRASRESSEWQKLYLQMGEGLEDFTLNRSADSPQPFHFASKVTSPENDRSDSRTSRLDSDSEEESDEGEDEDVYDEELQRFLPRQGQGGMRARVPAKRDIGKALRMLGIA